MNYLSMIFYYREFVEMFKDRPRGFPQAPVFTFKGLSMADMKRSFATACKQARIEDFTFLGLRHTAINTGGGKALL